MALSHSPASVVPSTRARRALAVGALAVGGVLAAAPAALAAAPAEVRFLHAVPGAGQATLSDGAARLQAGFGDVSDYRAIPSGRQELTLAPKGGGDALATMAQSLAPGARYTVVAVPVGAKVVLKAYEDATSSRPASSTLLRIVHAAPELGSPDVWLGTKKLAGTVPFEASSGYAAVPAGTTTLALAAPGKKADPLLSADVDLQPGRPLSVFVVGSKGEQVRAVAVRDVRSTGGGSSSVSSTAGTSGSTYVMRRGDNLWKLAARREGPGASDTRVLRELHRIWFKNDEDVPGGDPNVIPVGQRLSL